MLDWNFGGMLKWRKVQLYEGAQKAEAHRIVVKTLARSMSHWPCQWDLANEVIDLANEKGPYAKVSNTSQKGEVSVNIIPNLHNFFLFLSCSNVIIIFLDQSREMLLRLDEDQHRIVKTGLEQVQRGILASFLYFWWADSFFGIFGTRFSAWPKRMTKIWWQSSVQSGSTYEASDDKNLVTKLSSVWQHLRSISSLSKNCESSQKRPSEVKPRASQRARRSRSRCPRLDSS